MLSNYQPGNNQSCINPNVNRNYQTNLIYYIEYLANRSVIHPMSHFRV